MKVEDNKSYGYIEHVNEFTGLTFHCPHCDQEFHINVATCTLTKPRIIKAKQGSF